MFMPFQVLGIWLRGLFALLLLAVGIFLFARWYSLREQVVVVSVPPASIAAEDNPERNGSTPAQQEERRVVRWQFGFNRETAYLLAGSVLIGWSLGFGWLLSPRFFRRRGDAPAVPRPEDTRHLVLADGSAIHVEFHGPADGDPVVLVHGWGLDSGEWCYAAREWAGRYRLVTWDLPGLGRSSRPPDRDWSLEKLARDLDAVLALLGNKPAVLVGHSIGGMILLTYCKLFPAALGTRVRALVLAQSTYTNPVRTTARSGLYTALQKPLLEPLCHLMVWLAPLVRVLNGLSYLNGSAHRSTERSSFSGQETREQLEFITRYYSKAPPDVIGRGMLAMFRYDATDILGGIPVPTLIVTGDQDATCRPEASRFMAESIPGAKLVSLEQAKHCGLFEHHEAFHAAVAAFLAAEPQRLPKTGPRLQEAPRSHV